MTSAYRLAQIQGDLVAADMRLAKAQDRATDEGRADLAGSVEEVRLQLAATITMVEHEEPTA